MKTPYIGLKKVWYGDAFEPKTPMTKSVLANWLKTATNIKCVHTDTWEYSHDDPETTDYINELTGKPYYRDATSVGNRTITFTIGEYDYEDKAALQGGDVVEEGGEVIGWKSPTEPQVIYKAMVALTKTGQYVVFPNAAITGKVNNVEKNMGLQLAALATESADSVLSDEYWYDSKAVDDVNVA